MSTLIATAVAAFVIGFNCGFFGSYYFHEWARRPRVERQAETREAGETSRTEQGPCP